MLKQMLEMQEFLNTNVINKMDPEKEITLPHYAGANDKLRRIWVDRFASALQAEVCETREAATQEVKWWKDKTKDMPGLKEEIMDCWHFLMSMSLAAGMTADEIFERYTEKNKQNLVRKDWTVNQ